MKKRPYVFHQPVCQWDWAKMKAEERRDRYVCRCYHECHKRKEEEENRKANAKGILQRLAAWLKS